MKELKPAFSCWLPPIAEQHTGLPFGCRAAASASTSSHKWGAGQTWITFLRSNKSCFIFLQSEEMFFTFLHEPLDWANMSFNIPANLSITMQELKKNKLEQRIVLYGWFKAAVCGNALFIQSWIPKSHRFLQFETQQLVRICVEEIPGSQSLLLWGQTFFECCLMPVQMKSADCSVIWELLTETGANREAAANRIKEKSITAAAVSGF